MCFEGNLFQKQLDELIINQNKSIQIIYTDDDIDSTINLKKLKLKMRLIFPEMYYDVWNP